MIQRFCEHLIVIDDQSKSKKYKKNNIYSKLGTALAVTYFHLFLNLGIPEFEKYMTNMTNLS